MKAMCQTLIISEELNGPPSIGQGGFVAGSLASAMSCDGPVSVTLKAPTPLRADLSLETTRTSASLYVDDQLLASAAPRSPMRHLTPVACPAIKVIEAATARYRGHWDKKAFGDCFVCGVKRKDRIALKIFAGPVSDNKADGVAAFWVPNALHGDDEGVVDKRFLWAALDCPGFFAALDDDELALLANYSVEIYGAPKVNDTLIVVGWPIMRQGRKRTVGTALYSLDGELLGKAEGLWIQIDAPPEMA